MKRLLVVLAACHHPAEEPTQIGPPPPGDLGPAPDACPGVLYACTDPAVGCFEGADDFRDAAKPHCKQVGGFESGHCDATGTLGACTLYGRLVPGFSGCNTQWIRRGQEIQTPEDGKKWCAKFHGTWTTTP